MGDSGKRFGWTEDGLDAKDRIQKNDLGKGYKTMNILKLTITVKVIVMVAVR